MAVQAYTSNQLVDGYRATPIEDHGKLRFQAFDFTAAAAGDATSTINLCNLPSGRVRVLPWLSRISNDATNAGVTLSVGTLAYENRDSGAPDDPGLQAADPVALTPVALDISAANDSVPLGQVYKYDFYSKAGITVQATVNVGIIPLGTKVSGMIAYIYE